MRSFMLFIMWIIDFYIGPLDTEGTTDHIYGLGYSVMINKTVLYSNPA